MGELNFIFKYIWPETIFFILVVYLFILTMLAKRRECCSGAGWLSPVIILSVVAAAAAAAGEFAREDMFFGSYRVDGLSQFFKILISVGFALTVLNSLRQPSLKEKRRVEYFLYMTISAWGLVILSSANELVTIYLALELSSYALYILIPVRAKSKEAAEAGLKYILFGAAATAVALYGV